MKTKKAMKKNNNLWLAAALVCGVSLGAASCKDSNEIDDGPIEPASEVSIDSEVVTHGIEMDMQSAVVELPVKSDGLWTATLPAGVDWMQILDWQVTYEGDATLTLAVDENLTKADRTAELKIGNSEGEVQTVTVRQNYNYKGEAPDNGSGLAFANKGLGTGIDYDYALNVKSKENTSESFDPTMIHGLNNLFNIVQIERLKEAGKLQKSAYVESVIPLAELQASMLDSSLVQSKHLDLALDLEVSFGIIEFKAHADYSSDKDERKAHVDYTIVRNAPMYNVYVAPGELATYAAANRHVDTSGEDAEYERIEELIESYKKKNEKRKRKDVNEDGLTEEQQEIIDAMYDAMPVNYDHAGIFSSNFTRRYNELYNAIELPRLRGKSTDKASADQTLNAIDNEYGPFFIAGGNYGGAMVVHCLVDTMYLEGKATFGGALSAEMAGLFNVSGEFHYTEEGLSLMRDFNMDINIVGGNANDTADAMMGALFSGNATDLNKWQGMMKDWLASMYSGSWDPSDPNGQTPNTSQATPIMFTMTPIWSLFAEPAIQEYVQNYFIEKYKARGIEGFSNIMHGTMKAPGANALLNANSDFWK